MNLSEARLAGLTPAVMENLAAGTYQDEVFASGGLSLPSVSLTRPADTTAYAVGDVLANSTTLGSVVVPRLTVARVPGGSGFIRGISATKTSATLTNASLRLHIYLQQPTLTNADNGAWQTSLSGYRGAFDLTFDRAFSNGAFGRSGAPLSGSEIPFVLASPQTDIWIVPELRAAYGPASGEVFTFVPEVYPN